MFTTKNPSLSEYFDQADQDHPINFTPTEQGFQCAEPDVGMSAAHKIKAKVEGSRSRQLESGYRYTTCAEVRQEPMLPAGRPSGPCAIYTSKSLSPDRHAICMQGSMSVTYM